MQEDINQTKLNIEIAGQSEEEVEVAKENLATFGLFLRKSDAEAAIAKLEKSGFARENISLLAPQQNGSRDFVYQQRTSVKEGAITGALTGFVVLGIVGFFLGYTNLTQFENIRTPIEQGGVPTWIISSIIGGLVGLFFGAVSGALVGIGTPKAAAKRYGFYLKEGGIMLSVQLKNEAEREKANAILEKTRAQDITELNESEIWRTIVPEKKKLVFN